MSRNLPLVLVLLVGLVMVYLMTAPAQASRVIFHVPVARHPVDHHIPLTSSTDYRAIAYNDALDVGLDAALFVRQINEESGFNPSAVSPVGAIGIAQFMPQTAASLGINPYNPYAALKGAARLMKSYVTWYNGDYAKALAAYNAGSGWVQRAVTRCGIRWRVCLPVETQSYIGIILKGA